MLLESVELKQALGRLLDGKGDLVSKTHDNAINTCIKMIVIYEEREVARNAKKGDV